MKISLLILLIFVSVSLYSQRNTYYGAELGLTNPRLLHSNSNNISYRNDFGHPIFGFSLRQELGKKISLETGYFYHIYMEEFLVYQIYSAPGVFTTHQIPVLMHISKDVYKDRIQLFASIGPLFCLQTQLVGAVSEGFDGSGKKISVLTNNGEQFYTLIGGELGIHYKVVDELLLSLTGGFHYGLKKIREYDIEYWDEDVLLSSMKSYSKGEFWKITFGLSYPLGRIRKLVREAYDSAIEDGTLRK